MLKITQALKDKLQQMSMEEAVEFLIRGLYFTVEQATDIIAQAIVGDRPIRLTIGVTDDGDFLDHDPFCLDDDEEGYRARLAYDYRVVFSSW